MRAERVCAVFVLLAIFAAGCALQSFHPFCAEVDEIEVPELHGKWRLLKVYGEDKSDKKIGDWEISSGEMVCFDENNVKSELKASFFKIGDSVFADLTAGEIGEDQRAVNIYWLSSVVPVHVAAKFAISGDELIITPADCEAVEERLEDGRLKLEHVKRGSGSGGGEILLTAGTAELKKFLLENKDDAEIFSPKKSLVFGKVKKQTEEAK
jgi:hypothetical protein